VFGVAASKANKPLLEYLITKYPEYIELSNRFGLTPLLCAIHHNNNTDDEVLEIVKLLIQHGADINLPVTGDAGDGHWGDTKRGCTPLVAALEMGHVKTSNFLFKEHLVRHICLSTNCLA
jgi:ankyrin repeat protein